MLLPRTQQRIQHGVAQLPQAGCLAPHVVGLVVLFALPKIQLVGSTTNDLRPVGCCAGRASSLLWFLSGWPATPDSQKVCPAGLRHNPQIGNRGDLQQLPAPLLLSSALSCPAGLNTYPTYAMGGGYVLSADVVHTLLHVNQTMKLKFTPIEDATVGFWLMSMDLRFIHHPKILGYAAPCCFKLPVRREGQRIVTRWVGCWWCPRLLPNVEPSAAPNCLLVAGINNAYPGHWSKVTGAEAD